MGQSGLSIGDIVLVDLPDPDGLPCNSLHPAMVFRGPDPTGTIYVVAITSSFDPVEKHLVIPMPWADGGHPLTGLWKPCVMKCWWVVRLKADSVTQRLGVVPAEIAEMAFEYISTAVEEKRIRPN